MSQLTQLVESSGAQIGITWHSDPAVPYVGSFPERSKVTSAASRAGKPSLLCISHASTQSLPERAEERAAEPMSASDEIDVSANRSYRETDMVNVLSRTRPTISMDMRGQIIRGSRVESEDESSFTIDKYMDDFENIRESLKTDQLAILAYSPGGFFATHYAIKYPRRVSALILAEPAVFTEQEDLTQRALLAEAGDGAKAMEAMVSYIDPELSRDERERVAADVVKDWQSATVIGRVFRLHATSLISDEMLRPLRKIPTLLIGGTASPMNFHVKRIASVVPEASVWWVQGANHLDIVDARYADEIASVVNRFLDTL